MKTKEKVLCFCLAFVLGVAAQAGFICDIHINAAENPSLSFGEADAETRSPFPPYSGMFGVADVCFAGPANAEKWYDRLGEDVKLADPANTWVLVAKSNARLTFKLQAGGTPGDLFIVYKDVKTGDPAAPVSISDGVSFSVKTGGVYTITRDNDAAPEDNPQGDSSEFVPKDGSGEVAVTPPENLQKIKISFVAAQGVVAYVGEDVTQRTPPDVDWWFSVSRPGYEVEYNWTTLYTELEVTLTLVTREGGEGDDLNVSMTPTRSGAPPITTTLEFLDDQDTLKLTKTIDWILQRFGTLDFDGDGVVTLDDATYFYNYMASGGGNELLRPYITASNLLTFTENADAAKAAQALEFFNNNLQENNFDDGATGTTLDDATYFYNYMASGGGSEHLRPYITASNLTTFTESATSDDATVALDKLNELASE